MKVGNGWKADVASRLPGGSNRAVTNQWLHIVPRDKPGLLIAMMRALAGEAHISLEGDLRRIDLTGIAPIGAAETSLGRQTFSPTLDFVVLPLTSETQPLIWSRLSVADHLAADGIIHTQIEKNGRLAFGAYDNFHRDCVGASDAVPVHLLEKLKESGVIRSFGPAME